VGKLRRATAGFVLLAFTAVAGYFAVTRARVRWIGDRTFFEDRATYRFSGGFFSGLRTGPRFPAVVEQMESALQRYPGRAFFGPRMEFGYAVFQQPAGRGIPLFWHNGSAYAASDIPGIVEAFDRAGFQTLIFLKDDFTHMPLELRSLIEKRYVKIRDYPELTVFVLTPQSSANAKVEPRKISDTIRQEFR
jgi:hypothetical protein